MIKIPNLGQLLHFIPFFQILRVQFQVIVTTPEKLKTMVGFKLNSWDRKIRIMITISSSDSSTKMCEGSKQRGHDTVGFFLEKNIKIQIVKLSFLKYPTTSFFEFLIHSWGRNWYRSSKIQTSENPGIKFESYPCVKSLLKFKYRFRFVDVIWLATKKDSIDSTDNT